MVKKFLYRGLPKELRRAPAHARGAGRARRRLSAHLRRDLRNLARHGRARDGDPAADRRKDSDWLERQRVHFLYVGEGALAPRVRSILGADLGRPFVTLAGIRPQAETPRTLAASDILLSPHVPNPDGTPFFGSPTKLFEYMAMGKPIVASDLDQIGWVLKAWRPGEAPPAAGAAGRTRASLLVEPGSAESLVAGIRQAVEMPNQEREALGAETRRLALESFMSATFRSQLTTGAPREQPSSRTMHAF